MKFIEIKEYLNGLYPPERSFSWDNDGVEVCNNEETDVKNILLCLDITPEVADYAVNNGFQLIISHHPLLYSPVKKLVCSTPEMKTGLKLYKSNIAAMSFHTRLDSAVNGVNDTFIQASKLHCIAQNITPFGNDENDAAGRIVDITDKNNLFDLAVYIRDNLCEFLVGENFDINFNLQYIDAGVPVKKAAVVAGSGLMFLDDAVCCGADTFITGEAGYNKLISAAGRNMNFILCNHFESEAVVLPMLKSLIHGQFGDAKVEIWTKNMINELHSFDEIR